MEYMSDKYKAIIVDFDRTLLRTDKTISELTLDVLNDQKNSGMKLFAATARPERAITSYCEQIQFDAEHVIGNVVQSHELEHERRTTHE